MWEEHNDIQGTDFFVDPILRETNLTNKFAPNIFTLI